MDALSTGGSEAGLNCLGYIIQNAPGIAMQVMPSLDMVRRNTTVRIDPLIEATPALRELGVNEIAVGKDCQVRYPAGKSRRFSMPTRNINLTAEQDAFVEEVVRAGMYQNASEAMRDAVRGLQQRLETDALKLDLLRSQVKAGIIALDRGAFTEVDDTDLDATLDNLAANDSR